MELKPLNVEKRAELMGDIQEYAIEHPKVQIRMDLLLKAIKMAGVPQDELEKLTGREIIENGMEVINGLQLDELYKKK